MIQPYTQQNKVFFYTIMVILGALGLWLVSGYLGAIDGPTGSISRPGWTTTATIIALFLAIIVPSWMTLRIVTNQVNTIIESFSTSASGEPLTLEDVRQTLENSSGRSLEEIFSQWFDSRGAPRIQVSLKSLPSSTGGWRADLELVQLARAPA